MNEMERARVEEEFQIVYRLGLRKEPMDLKSAMMNVDDLVKVAHERGRKDGVIEFYDKVCKQAEENMLKTGKLEGAHFAAMRKEIEAIRTAMEAK